MKAITSLILLCFYYPFSNYETICHQLKTSNCKMLDIVYSDSVIYSKDYPIFFYYANRPNKDNEVFEPSDTLNRDTLVVYDKKFTIDELILSQIDYSGAYSLHCACEFDYHKTKYFILIFYDGYQMGTQQQTLFLIFSSLDNHANFHSSYIENLNYPSSKIKLLTSKKGITLRSKNIDRFK